MASIVLSNVGSAVGSQGGPVGSYIGSRIGQFIGQAIDKKIFGVDNSSSSHRYGSRLLDLGVQTSTYGNMIPIIYGTMRIGGNIIWSQPIREIATTTSTSSSSGGKGGGGKVTQTTTTYSYDVTLAIAICEGPLDDVIRIWADAKQLDLSQYTLRIYKGDETQTADSLMQSYDGVENTPAYRGLAYVIFEQFPLADFGNRIPNFTFEIQRKAQHAEFNGDILEDLVTGITMIPGGGEFVYDTQVQNKIPGVSTGGGWSQQGAQVPINMHNVTGEANALLSLDQMEATCTNLEWVSVVVTWFGDDMDAGTCIVQPGVEFQTGATTSSDTWQVGSYTRSTARQITLEDGSPRYGGTPDDDSILRYLTELRDRGYSIMFYPIMFMDVDGKPWRGELTGSATDVASFFTKTNGYNAFISHYASLVDGYVDAFVIGSELKGLTSVTDTPGNYPAVNALVSLAASVKATLGSSVKVTYAADWSEYHHTDGGWYNMDPLWASSDIDMIGIDAYFPLTDHAQNGYDVQEVIDGWTSGEGYDWYYSDPGRTVQTPLSPEYAWKNIQWFWENTHTDPDMSTTSWVAESKPIWFTEFGFPSVDGATNQPNVFYDPESNSSAFPYYSKGRVDLRAQRAGLMGTLQQWKASSMVERMFVWTWDARPYPYWPDLTSVWSDGGVWKTGHWVQGKFGISSLAAIILDICERAGFDESDLDVSHLTELVEGYVIAGQQTARNAIETLQVAYFFDSVESDSMLEFIPRGADVALQLNEQKLVPFTRGDDSARFHINRLQEVDLPKRVNVVYLNRLYNYQNATQYSQRQTSNSRQVLAVDLPIVLSDQSAKIISDVSLFTAWHARTQYIFDLPVEYGYLEPSDVIEVTADDNTTHRMRITSIRYNASMLLRIEAVAEDPSTYDFYSAPGIANGRLTQSGNTPDTQLELLDLPALPGSDPDKGELHYAAAGLASGWTGAAIYRSDDGGSSYNRIIDVNSAAIMGSATGVLADGTTHVFDETNTVEVVLITSGELHSVTELAVLNGSNAAIIGSEVVQFKTATLVEPGKYTLSGLLRGRLGTEWATSSHVAGERFVLLDGRIAGQTLANSFIGLSRSYKPVSVGSSVAATAAQDFTYQAIGLKPYSPVHVTATRDGSGSLTINWVRRTRVGGHWQDNVEVPLSETREAYEVDILNGGTVVRTISGLATEQASYSAAEQTTDFGSPQSSVDIKVYQISGYVGRGYAAVATV